jgi:hypothetical protein
MNPTTLRFLRLGGAPQVDQRLCHFWLLLLWLAPNGLRAKATGPQRSWLSCARKPHNRRSSDSAHCAHLGVACVSSCVWLMVSLAALRIKPRSEAPFLAGPSSLTTNIDRSAVWTAPVTSSRAVRATTAPADTRMLYGLNGARASADRRTPSSSRGWLSSSAPFKLLDLIERPTPRRALHRC